jgi:hypothetical protein
MAWQGIYPISRWSNLAKFLPLVRARIVSEHLTQMASSVQSNGWEFCLSMR